MRIFYLDRHEDISGVSGTGRVAEGIEFSDGTCVFKWLTQVNSLAYHHSLENVQEVHGHDGKTTITIGAEIAT